MDNTERLKGDFRVFLYVVWQYINLPQPSEVQYDIAKYLQHGPNRRIIQAFRGVGKSYITVAYVLWRLLRDPQIKVMVVSASNQAAMNFSSFCLQLIRGMPELRHLMPHNEQRDSKIQFDVGPATESKDPSVRCVGITGQLTGSRADLIVPDDVEAPSNSMTQQQRDKLAELVKEFDAILKPNGDIVYLGTPQTEASLYSLLETRGYSVCVWPARYVSLSASQKTYGNRIASLFTQKVTADPSLVGQSVWPSRFDEQDLTKREFSYGRSGFALQFMLDTSLSDALRYPLKLADLIVMDLNPKEAPEKIVWATSPELTINDLPTVGLAGDRYYRPMFISKDLWVPYTSSVLTIDPSGRGKDELGFCVGKLAHGTIFCTALGGLQGGYADANLEFLAKLAKAHGVNKVLIESNFGDGMFTQLIKPVLVRCGYPCTVEEIHHSGQKEKRIIDTLEPVMNQHRLVVDRKVIQMDYQVAQEHYGDRASQYQAFYQLSRITKDRGALVHDDRVEALAMMVAHFVQSMAVDSDLAAGDLRQEQLEEQLKGFVALATSQLLGVSQEDLEPAWFSR